jgi:outer membrane protein TolC
MSPTRGCWESTFVFVAVLGIVFGGRWRPSALGQEEAPRPTPVSEAPGIVPSSVPPLAAGAKPYPVNLATALQLGNANALDVALATERVQVAAAQLERARVLWLPTLYVGTDYFRHDGPLQDSPGNVFGTSKQSFMVGVGASAVFAVSEALFAPLAARQVLRARQATVQAAANDTLLAVAEAYFTVQQARGELAGAEDSVRRAEDLLGRTEKLAPGLLPALEITRARTDLARRRQLVQLAQERWRLASADLVRVLRLDPAVVVQPLEPPHLQVPLVDADRPIDDLIPVGLMNRPELASQRALVQATLQLLRQERLRPLLPSLLLRPASTPVTGTLSAGVFGGGLNGSMNNFSLRQDWDIQVVWQLENLGFGNRGRVRERAAENRAALLELFRVQDRVAAEVVQAHAQLQTATTRAQDAEQELRNALESVEQNLVGLGQTKRAGDLILLVIRPQEVVAAIQALSQAYADYYGAIADANRAQFRLYRALGEPAQALLHDSPCNTAVPPPAPPDTPVSAPCPPPVSSGSR